MAASSISCSRTRRSTAGFNKRYDEQEYVLVSFPQLNKHSIVPSACVNVDPLDKQNGMIKTFGSRKNLRIIGSGSKESMQERASRYASSAGSEEIDLGADPQENDENQERDDHDFSPSSFSRVTTNDKKQSSTKEQLKANINATSTPTIQKIMATSNNDDSPSSLLLNREMSCHRQLNFDRVYSPRKEGKRRPAADDESSLSGSDELDDQYHDDLPVTKKTNDVQSILKRSRRSRKKQSIPPVRNVEGPCTGCIKHEQEIIHVRKRLERLEKVIPVIKKFRSNSAATTITTGQSSVPDIEHGVYVRVKTVSGIHPNQIKSTPSRPTMVMRELIKKAGHIGDKQCFKQNEDLFKEFIQIKCIINDDNLDSVWKEILDSINRQHIDEENNKKKRINKEALLRIGIEPSVQSSQSESIDEEHELIISTSIQREADEQ